MQRGRLIPASRQYDFQNRTRSRSDDPGDAVGRKEQLAQVFPAPPVGQSRCSSSRCRSIRLSLGCSRSTADAVRIEEEVAEIEVFVKDASAMQGCGDPGHLGDDSPF